MNELVEKLRNADSICKEFYPYFESANKQMEEAEEKLKDDKKTRTVISAVVGIFVWLLLSEILMDTLRLPGFFNFVAILIGGLAGKKLYTSVFFPKITEYYNVSMKEALKIEQKGKLIMEEHQAELSVIPEEYWYPMATEYLLKVVQTERAENVNQALSMYDEQLHRWKLEEANAAILEEQIKQTEALKGIRRSSAVNATANVTSAIFNIANFFR